MTQPSRSVTYDVYELVVHGVTVGISDHIQATLTVLAPLVDALHVGTIAVKARISPAQRLHLAAQTTVSLVHVGNLDPHTHTAETDAVSLGLGGYASVCLRSDCASLVNAIANYQYAPNYTDAGPAHLLIYGGSLVLRAGEHVKLLGEITSAAGRDASGFSIQYVDHVFVSYGLRLHGDSLAADVGLIRPVDISTRSAVGWPLVSLSCRFD